MSSVTGFWSSEVEGLGGLRFKGLGAWCLGFEENAKLGFYRGHMHEGRRPVRTHTFLRSIWGRLIHTILDRVSGLGFRCCDHIIGTSLGCYVGCFLGVQYGSLRIAGLQGCTARTQKSRGLGLRVSGLMILGGPYFMLLT